MVDQDKIKRGEKFNFPAVFTVLSTFHVTISNAPLSALMFNKLINSVIYFSANIDRKDINVV